MPISLFSVIFFEYAKEALRKGSERVHLHVKVDDYGISQNKEELSRCVQWYTTKSSSDYMFDDLNSNSITHPDEKDNLENELSAKKWYGERNSGPQQFFMLGFLSLSIKPPF